MADRSEAKSEGKRARRPFTPGWADQLDGEEGLPIKRGSKVFKVKKAAVDRPRTEEDGEEVVILDEQEEQEKEAATPKAPVKERKAAVPVAPLAWVERSFVEEDALKQKIADICTSITANPEAAILRKGLSEADAEEYGIKDLLAACTSRDVAETELALLSASLVFKDICPSYRIRTDKSDDADLQLKKETQKMRDFELALLKAYQRLLRILEDHINTGLGKSTKNALPAYSLAQQIGLVALRCQCELLRGLSQFNLRSNLLAAITQRAAQPDDQVTEICCDALEDVLRHDTGFDLSFEFVTTVSKVLTTSKFAVPPRLLRVLQTIKLTVHEDKVKALQIKVKSDRKKRKRNQDSAEATMLEANVEGEKYQRQRFQGNCLQEVALIYFRILKAKVGFGLLPIALEGLGKVTHLINLDTVNDLLSNLRHLLTLEPKPPLEVRLLCVHCALSTLTGPGEELKVDIEPYVLHLLTILREVPWDEFAFWPAAVDALDMVLLRRRAEGSDRVQIIVRLLLIHACHRLHDIGHVLLSLLHNILLRYPRLRESFQERWQLDARVYESRRAALEDDDKVEDLAMQALREGANAKHQPGHISDHDELADGAWALALVKGHPDARYRRIVDVILAKEISPLPFKAADAGPAAGKVEDEEGEDADDAAGKAKGGRKKSRSSYFSQVKNNPKRGGGGGFGGGKGGGKGGAKGKKPRKK